MLTLCLQMKKTLIHFLYRPLSAVVLVLVMAAGAVAQQRNAETAPPIATKRAGNRP